MPESTTSDQNRSWRSTLSIPETTILLNLGSRSPPPDARDTCLRDHRITALGTKPKTYRTKCPANAMNAVQSRWHLGLRSFLFSTGSCRGQEPLTSFEIRSPPRIDCKLLKRWSGRPGSNRRRPAWEFVTPLNLQHFRVSGASSRLSQVSLNHHSTDQNLLIEAQSRYTALAFVPRFAQHSETNFQRVSGGYRECILRLSVP